MSQNSLRLFLSYSHKDDKFRRDLTTHLSPLRHQGLIVGWTDRLISPGVEWEKEINKELEKADIVILFISSDFINSNYCFGIEMTKALDRHEKGLARVIPIIARPCLWQGLPFAKLQVLPYEAKPIKLWNDKDSAYLSIVQGIENSARELLEKTSTIVSEWSSSLLARRKVVRIVQSFLKDKGLYAGTIDGEPANLHLREAVRLFQQQVGISTDGLIGPETLRAIYTELEKNNSCKMS
jgi:hypothetical protein